MAKRKVIPEPGKVQIVWEGILKWSAFAIMVLQLSLGIITYFFSDLSNTLIKAEKWAVLGLIVIACAYALYTRIKTPLLMFRMKNFIKGLLCPEMIVLICFFLWTVFCTLSADKRYAGNFFLYNDGALFDTFVSVFILFIMAYIFREDRASRLMGILFHVFCASLTLFMVYVLIVICRPGLINLPSGGQIGMDTHVRLCINCNPNTTGAIAEVVLLMCVYMVITQKGLLRWLYAAASVVHYFILILSNSRTCIISAGIAVAAIVGKLCFDALKNKALWQRALIAVFSGAAAAGLIIGLRKPVFSAYEAISHFMELLGKSNSIVARDADISLSGRKSIWLAAIKSIFQDETHFFFGVTPAGVIREVSIWDAKHKEMYTHNQFLEIAVAHGFPGMLMYLAWLAMIAKSCVKIVLGKIKEMNKGLIVLAGMILMLVIANLMEATLMYYRFFTEGVFFLICGIITYRVKEKK